MAFWDDLDKLGNLPGKAIGGVERVGESMIKMVENLANMLPMIMIVVGIAVVAPMIADQLKKK